MQDIRLVAILLNCIKEIKKKKKRLVVTNHKSVFHLYIYSLIMCSAKYQYYLIKLLWIN